jgi:sporulation protein YlmC with PRC-barrel domain
MNITTPGTRASLETNGAIGPSPAVLSATTIIGDEVCNLQDEKLGKIDDIMLDAESGKICYAVLSSGGFLGMGDKLLAIPWAAIQLDQEQHRFILDVDVERLKNAPGFDKSNWPDMADATWANSVHSYFGTHDRARRS